MMKKMRHMVIFPFALLIALIFSMPVNASYLGYSRMQEAMVVPFGETTSGTLNETGGTYFYFEIPSKLNVKIKMVYGGTDYQELELYRGNDGKYITGLYGYSECTYDKLRNTTTAVINETLNKGGYYVAVKGFIMGDPYSLTLSGTMPQRPSLTKVQNIKNTTAKITWTGASGASAYEIYRASSANGSYKKIKTVSKSIRTFKDKGLKKRKKYYYKVRAYRIVKKKKYYSSFSGKRSVTVKK